MNTCRFYAAAAAWRDLSGPIGLIIDPTFNAHKYSNLPFASTLGGGATASAQDQHHGGSARRQGPVKRHDVPSSKRRP
jgi:L-lactate dehydrogenase complex protein LldF